MRFASVDWMHDGSFMLRVSESKRVTSLVQGDLKGRYTDGS